MATMRGRNNRMNREWVDKLIDKKLLPEGIADTVERPLVFVRGIPRAFLWATKENVVR